MTRGLVTAAILAITTLSFFVFPGHTYLQQDTQIYVPILENQWSGALSHDLIVERPHVNFTLYDELTNGLRWVTHLPLKTVLQAEQLFFRALGFLGIYLIALALGLDAWSALVVTALWALGAAIKGPEVLTVEYEPTPRAFAVPLLILSTGCLLHKRDWWAGIAAAAAFTLHAPTTWPFLLACACLAIVRRRAALALIPVMAATAVLLVVGYEQPVGEAQHFFQRLAPRLEELQRLRAAYNYVSTWWAEWMIQYAALAVLAACSLRVLRVRLEAALLLGGLVVAGLLSLPLSWLLLEREKLALVPQVQPARALLFVSAIAVIGTAAAGCRTALEGKRLWSAGWFCLPLLVASQTRLLQLPPARVAVVLVACSLALAWSGTRWRTATALAIAPALLLAAGILNYRNIEDGELALLATWARDNTPAACVFVFPDSGRDRQPGWFRAAALRAVYVDWKGGGQVNYLEDLGYEWWRRWQAAMLHPSNPERCRPLPVNYIAVRRVSAMNLPLVYRGKSWFVYAARSSGRL